jgi:hypothetical protein
MAVEEVQQGAGDTAFAFTPAEGVPQHIDQIAEYLYVHCGNHAPDAWAGEALIIKDFWWRQAIYVTSMVTGEILEQLEQPSSGGMPQSTDSVHASGTARNGSRGYHPDDIFSRVMAVRDQRTKQYNSEIALGRMTAHKYFGQAITGVLNSWLRQYGIEIPIIPSWVSALIMVTLKATRIAIAPQIEDSYDDALNYVAIAEECATEEGVLTHEY